MPVLDEQTAWSNQRVAPIPLVVALEATVSADDCFWNYRSLSSKAD